MSLFLIYIYKDVLLIKMRKMQKLAQKRRFCTKRTYICNILLEKVWSNPFYEENSWS